VSSRKPRDAGEAGARQARRADESDADGPTATAVVTGDPPAAEGGSEGPAASVELEFRNPLSDLPETARNLILSAKTIIAEQGFEALTLNRLAAASGENKAMTAYYFGNKAGLVAAVLDSVIHDEYLASEARMKNLSAEELTPRVIEEMHGIVSSAEDFRVFYELLPRVLRDDVLRARMLPLYRWYWSVKLEWLGFGDDPAALDDPDLQGIARLLSAMIDGLAIQAMIEPKADLSGPYRILGRLVGESLPRFVAERSARGDATG
jgi:AcrR family transcriptional regulator